MNWRVRWCRDSKGFGWGKVFNLKKNVYLEVVVVALQITKYKKLFNSQNYQITWNVYFASVEALAATLQKNIFLQISDYQSFLDAMEILTCFAWNSDFYEFWMLNQQKQCYLRRNWSRSLQCCRCWRSSIVVSFKKLQLFKKN